MADINKELYQFLDQNGVNLMAKGILDKVNVRIAQRIVQQLDITDTTHVPSASAVLKAIQSARHTTIQTVIGDINVEVPLNERSTDVLYLQKDNESDTTWMMYIWDADPNLHPDPNGKWINIGDTEIDLSGYWSKSAADMEDLANQLGIPVINANIEDLQSAVTVLDGRVDTIDEEIVAINTDLEKKLYKDDVAAIPDATVIKIVNDAESDTDPFAVPCVDPASVEEAISAAVASGKTSVSVRVASDMDLRIGSTETIAVPEGVRLTVNIPDDKKITVSDKNAFSVATGGTLVLNGEGTLVKTGKQAKGAITVENGGALIIDGITIDCTTQGTEENWAYGVYAKNSSTINFKSGTIKVAGASCIGTNNTTGGSTINVYGGELLADGGYAIYNPAQGTINIYGGTVQGINARMGTINISGDAKIISTTITAENAEDIGANINTSGSIAVGDAIALIAGSYSDPNGIDITVNIAGDATVESEFRSAIGVYMLDTKAAANVAINVAVGNNVSTSDAEYDAIKVYDHTYIGEKAAAAGKTYNPVATSNVTVTVEDVVVYPVAG